MVDLIFTTKIDRYFSVFFLYVLFFNEPEVFFPKYSRTAILHAAHFRRVVNGCIGSTRRLKETLPVHRRVLVYLFTGLRSDLVLTHSLQEWALTPVVGGGGWGGAAKMARV